MSDLTPERFCGTSGRVSIRRLCCIFLLHQPVIIVIAYFVVQWNAGIFAKLVTVVISSLLVTLALYEFVIRRVGFLRTIFGMKETARPSAAQPQEATSVSP